MVSYLRTLLLIIVFAAASSAQAQFKPVEIPPTPTVPTLPPPVQTLPPSLTIPPTLAPAPALTLESPVPGLAAPPAAVIVPGCPGRADCPPQPEAEGPLSEAAKEIIKEFVKCEAEAKSFDQCLLDDPPPSTLSSLNDDERTQLTGCLDSQDLSATRDFWEQCVVRLR